MRCGLKKTYNTTCDMCEEKREADNGNGIVQAAIHKGTKHIYRMDNALWTGTK